MTLAGDSPLCNPRFTALLGWCQQHLAPDLDAARLKLLGEEASFRRYYRVSVAGRNWLVVDADPATEDTPQFVRIAAYLREHNIHTPAIQAVDPEPGFLVVEDFGDNLLYRQLQAEPSLATANGIYSEALTTLLALQQCPDRPDFIPRYDRTLLRRELEIFTEWFVGALLEKSLSPAEQEMLQALFHRLEGSALEQPRVLIHRDYHSRNLISCPDGTIGVIDFQGALWGPCSYDPVSLLRDCYLRWPEDAVNQWATGYGRLMMAAGVIPTVDEATWLRWFDWMGLQRHIKVLGIFARVHLRDSKSHFLADLPRVIRYVTSVAGRYAELDDFSLWFEQQLMPLIRQQAWYLPEEDVFL
jgi:aminoglycoside/choline kinase family phosphotransferase